MISEFEKEQIVKYIRKKYPNERVSISFKHDKNIFIDKTHNAYYRYKFVNNELILARVVVLPIGDFAILVGGQLHDNISKDKVKTNKGKVRNEKKVMVVLGLSALILVGAIKSHNKINAGSVLGISNAVLEQTDIIIDSLGEKQEAIGDNGNDILTVEIPVMYQANEVLCNQKRAETDEIYGDLIEKYATRYGLPYSLTAAMFTQERSNNANHSELTKKNIGSLASVIGEKIVAPVIQDGAIVGEDKIYILPVSYDKFRLEDLQTMVYDKRDLGDDLDKIVEAARLQKEGYQIFKAKDIYDTKNNINIACAYLRSLVDKKHDIIKGYMSYNIGQNRINDDTTYTDILYGNIENNGMGDLNYLNHVAQYILDAEDGETLNVTFRDGSRQSLVVIKNKGLAVEVARK